MEDSLSDPSIHDLTGSESYTITYQLVDAGTQQAKMKPLASDGYSYNVKLRRANTTYWQCTVHPKGNQCKSIVVQRGNDFQLGTQSHNHQPTIGAAAVAKIMASVKEKAVADPFKPASAIVNEVGEYLFTVSYHANCAKPHFYDSRISCDQSLMYNFTVSYPANIIMRVFNMQFHGYTS